MFCTVHVLLHLRLCALMTFVLRLRAPVHVLVHVPSHVPSHITSCLFHSKFLFMFFLHIHRHVPSHVPSWIFHGVSIAFSVAYLRSCSVGCPVMFVSLHVPSVFMRRCGALTTDATTCVTAPKMIIDRRKFYPTLQTFLLEDDEFLAWYTVQKVNLCKIKTEQTSEQTSCSCFVHILQYNSTGILYSVFCCYFCTCRLKRKILLLFSYI